MSYFTYQSKQIFYSESGSGTPVIFLHGNTASSRMFEMLLPLYIEDFKVLLPDFLGNGRSDRLIEFPPDIWFYEAGQIIAFIEHLKLSKVNLVGTSGGAWVALNAALERPDLVQKVVADSFHGRTLSEDFSENLIAERKAAKSNPVSRQFYEWWQGEDWETVVDLDTNALLQYQTRQIPLFHKPLESLQVPVLFMGSYEDTMVRKNLVDEYNEMAKIVSHGEVHMFQTGVHPAIASNAEAAARVIVSFINNSVVE